MYYILYSRNINLKQIACYSKLRILLSKTIHENKDHLKIIIIITDCLQWVLIDRRAGVVLCKGVRIRI